MLASISPDRALEIVRANAVRRSPDRVRLDAADGAILSRAVCADRDFPPFNRAMMDGFAVRLSDVGQTAELVSEVAAGQAPAVELTDGRCVSVMTGAPCPDGTEAVVPLERAPLEAGRVRLPSSLVAGMHMATRGCDCPAGSEVLEEGQPVSPLTAAVLAAVGQEEVVVFRPPTISIITTGNELCAAGESPGAYQIRDSNGRMLSAQARQAGLLSPRLFHARDTAAGLRDALEEAAGADIVLLSGGVSVGRYDLVPEALRAWGAALIFHRVTQKPGKPLLFARKEAQLIFGLPGNPLASHLCFDRYVLPAARKMAGRPGRPSVHQGTLMRPLRVKSDRTVFLLGSGRFQGRGLVVQPLVGSGSADLFFKQRANGYLRVEPGDHRLQPDDHVSFQFHGGHR